MPACNVRLLLPASGDSGRLLCVASDGKLLLLDAATLTVLAASFLPGTPAEAEAADAAGLESQGEWGAAAASAGKQAVVGEDAALPRSHPASLAALGPEFEAAVGYRGPRQAPPPAARLLPLAAAA